MCVGLFVCFRVCWGAFECVCGAILVCVGVRLPILECVGVCVGLCLPVLECWGAFKCAGGVLVCVGLH